MSTTKSNQMIRYEQTIQGGHENIFEGVDIDYQINVTRTVRKKEFKIEENDLIMAGKISGIVSEIYEDIIYITWEFHRDSQMKYTRKEVIRGLKCGSWKLYKEVSIDQIKI